MVIGLIVVALKNILYISIIKNNNVYICIEVIISKKFFHNLDYVIKKLILISRTNLKNLSYIVVLIETVPSIIYNYLATVINSLTYVYKLPIITIININVIKIVYSNKDFTKFLSYFKRKNKFIKIYKKRLYQVEFKLLIRNEVLYNIINLKIDYSFIGKLLNNKYIKKSSFSRYISLFNYWHVS